MDKLLNSPVPPWIAALVTAFVWLLTEHRRRQVRVTGGIYTKGVWYAERSGPGRWFFDVKVEVFNGLTTSVGLHHVWMDVRTDSANQPAIIAPLKDKLPTSIEAQHSAVIDISGKAIYEIASSKHRGPLSCRIWLQLGNGRKVKTRMIVVPEPRQGSSGDNANSGY